MNKLNFGNIVLLRFPYTDGRKAKKRPALVLNTFDDGDIIACRVTSQIYSTKYDLLIENWEKAGLKLPSVIRVHKIATIEYNLVEMVIGKIEDSLKSEVKRLFSSIAE